MKRESLQTNHEERRIKPVSVKNEELGERDESQSRGFASWLFIGPILASISLLGLLQLLFTLEKDELVRSPKSLLINLFFLLFFLFVHTFFARGFGRMLLNKPFGPKAEKPLFVLSSGLALFLMVSFWTTCGPILWSIESGVFYWLSLLLKITGIVLICWSSIVIGLNEIFAISHIQSIERKTTTPRQELVALPPYSFIRHPLNLGFIILLLSMNEVTVDRLLMQIIFIPWILLISPIEEREAELSFGDGYMRYKEKTPRWIPRIDVPE